MSLPVFSTALHRARVAAKKKGSRKEAGQATPATQTPASGPTPAPRQPPAPPPGVNFKDAAEAVADRFTASGDSDLIKRMKERDKQK